MDISGCASSGYGAAVDHSFDRRSEDLSQRSGRVFAEKPRSPDFSVALLTPWNQQCGNAEFAKRLTVGLSRFAKILPIELENLIDHDTIDTRRAQIQYIDNLIDRANAAPADLVHVQHEFSFFGKRVRNANVGFRRLMRGIRKPVVLSLHTWARGMSLKPHRHLIPRLAEVPFHCLRNRAVAESIRRADEIILHSRETRAKCLAVYPKLRKRIHVLPIPVEPVNAHGVTPPYRKRPGEKWIVLPGFVSRYKGHRHLLAALEHMPADCRAVFAGGVHPKDRTGHEYWTRLLGLIDEMGCQERVLFTGFIGDPAEQAAVLGQADVFALPYDEVGQSGSAVLADALSYGKPVVTSLARSMFVYRHESDTVFSSLAVDVTEPEKFAAAITEAMNARACPRRRLHQQTVCDRFSLARTAAGYEQVYRGVLERVRRKTA
jgi:glycosyltransferase involved in cell wall biosynthesis